jgi:hypothetical protein
MMCERWNDFVGEQSILSDFLPEILACIQQSFQTKAFYEGYPIHWPQWWQEQRQEERQRASWLVVAITGKIMSGGSGWFRWKWRCDRYVDVWAPSSSCYDDDGCVAAGRSAASLKKHAPKILFQNVPQIIIVEMCTSYNNEDIYRQIILYT